MLVCRKVESYDAAIEKLGVDTLLRSIAGVPPTVVPQS